MTDVNPGTDPTVDPTTIYHREDLSVDQQIALRTAAQRLRREFEGTYGEETIERFLHTSYDQFAAHSTIPHFLPLLAERFARQRLVAQARIEGPVRAQRRPQPDGARLPTTSDGRSRDRLVRRFRTQHRDQPRRDRGDGRTRHRHLRRIPQAVDRRRRARRRRRGDHGLRRRLPALSGKRYLDLVLDDPAGQNVEEVRPIRDEIERRVRSLLDDLGVPVTN